MKVLFQRVGTSWVRRSGLQSPSLAWRKIVNKKQKKAMRNKFKMKKEMETFWRAWRS